jgi:feruloyl esterase
MPKNINFRYIIRTTLINVLSACLLAFGMASPAHADENEAQAACEKLARLAIPASAISLPTSGASVTSAALVTADTRGNANGEYCKVMGAIRPVDAAAPDIRWQVNLPTRWNSKALQSGGGGYNGSIPNTLGWPKLGLNNVPTPLAQGYVTLASDSGHQAKDNNDASFALNDEALANFGYMHIKKTLDVAVSLIKSRYGSAPKRVYFEGGSTGGREALTAVLRWPQAYDGALTNYPTANFMGLRLWGAVLARAIYDDNSAGWIPPALVRRIAAEAIAGCDELDGVKDGLVSNMAACRAQSPKLIERLRCKNGEQGHPEHCLTTAQIERTINVYHNGYTLPYAFAHGIRNYPGYNNLEGILMQVGSQAEYIEPPPTGPNAHHVNRADQFIKYFVARDPDFKLRTLDIHKPGQWQERIVRLSEILGASDPDFSALNARGGKVLWVHGLDDPSVSPYANAEVYRSIVKRMGQAATDNFLRFYLVPGLAHGGGNFSPVWDNLAILDNWVDRGIAPPAAPIMFDDTKSATRGRSRPMCAYPQWARYNGSGDVNLAASYRCVD